MPEPQNQPATPQPNPVATAPKTSPSASTPAVSPKAAAAPPKSSTAAPSKSKAMPPSKPESAAQSKSTPAPTPTPAATDSRRPAFHLPIGLSTIVAILILIFITELTLLGVLGNTLKGQITQTEVATSQAQDQQQAVSEINQYRDQIDQLSKSFPQEQGIIEFVQFVRQHSNDQAVLDIQISNNDPILPPQAVAPFLPVTISSSATPSAFLQIVSDINNSPYLFQPALLDITSPQGLTNQATIKYQGNLYVSPELVKK